MSKKTVAVVAAASVAFLFECVLEPSLVVYVVIALSLVILPSLFSSNRAVVMKGKMSGCYDVTNSYRPKASDKHEVVSTPSAAETLSRPVDVVTGCARAVSDFPPQVSSSCDRGIDTEHVGTIKSCSVQNGYGFIVCSNFEKDLIFSMSDIKQETASMVRPGKVVVFKSCEHKNGARAHGLKFKLEGHLKSFDAVRNHGFIICPGCSDVWFGRSDVVTVNPVLTAGTVVQFELYYGGNGKPRARRVEMGTASQLIEGQSLLGRVKSFRDKYCFIASDSVQGDVFLAKEEIPDEWGFLQVGVPLRFRLLPGSEKPKAHSAKMLVMTFRTALVKSYNPTSHYGFLSCDGLDEDVWFAGAAVKQAKLDDPSGFVDLQSLDAGTPVQADIFQRGDGQLRAFRVVTASQ